MTSFIQDLAETKLWDLEIFRFLEILAKIKVYFLLNSNMYLVCSSFGEILGKNYNSYVQTSKYVFKVQGFSPCWPVFV